MALIEHVTVHLRPCPRPIELSSARLGHLPLEDVDDLGNIAAGDDVHSNVENLPADVGVGTGQGPEDVHEKLLDDLGMLRLESLEALQDDELDVVVVLGVEEVRVSDSGGPDGRGGGGKRHQRPGGLVRDSGRRGREHLEQDPDEAGLLVGILLADLAGELED